MRRKEHFRENPFNFLFFTYVKDFFTNKNESFHFRLTIHIFIRAVQIAKKGFPQRNVKLKKKRKKKFVSCLFIFVARRGIGNRQAENYIHQYKHGEKSRKNMQRQIGSILRGKFLWTKKIYCVSFRPSGNIC